MLSSADSSIRQLLCGSQCGSLLRWLLCVHPKGRAVPNGDLNILQVCSCLLINVFCFQPNLTHDPPPLQCQLLCGFTTPLHMYCCRGLCNDKACMWTKGRQGCLFGAYSRRFRRLLVHKTIMTAACSGGFCIKMILFSNVWKLCLTLILMVPAE